MRPRYKGPIKFPIRFLSEDHKILIIFTDLKHGYYFKGISGVELNPIRPCCQTGLALEFFLTSSLHNVITKREAKKITKHAI